MTSKFTIMVCLSLFLFLGLSGCDTFPTPTESLITNPPEPTATLVPTQISGSPVWDPNQVSCEGKSLKDWHTPGIYTYKIVDSDGSRVYVEEINSTDNHWAVWAIDFNKPFDNACHFLASGFWLYILDEIPYEGLAHNESFNCTDSSITLTQDWSSSVSNHEQLTIAIGTFDTLRIDTLNTVDNSREIHNSVWFACGYGVVLDTTIDPSVSKELLSFTPLLTDKARVRYILADIQLGNVIDYYRENISDEETAEAIRQWDAGIRVININDFERKLINGQWQVIYAGTETPINGSDVILSTEN